MPIYEYRCTSCHRTVETIQKLNDPPLTKCEACKGKLEKIVSRTAFHLKGGGWFDQGYSPSSPASPADSGSDSKAPDKAKDKSPDKSPDKGQDKGQDKAKDKGQDKAKDKGPAKGEASSASDAAKPSKASSGGCGSGSCGCAN